MNPPSSIFYILAVILYICSGAWTADVPPGAPGHHHGRWLSPEYKWVYEYPLPIPSIKQEKWPDKPFHNPITGKRVKYYEVDITSFAKQIYPNLSPTPMIGYDGSYPCPAFLEEKGVESIVRFTNHGQLPSAAHLHGSYSRAPFDGWADDLIQPGHYKDYFYPNLQSARMVWYHDHAVAHTAENAYFGQAGPYIIKDPDEDALKLPSSYGKYDIPLVIAAKRYNNDGSLYSPANEQDNLYGDIIDINGQPWPYLKVEPRKYRLRILNAAISRPFLLYLKDGDGEEESDDSGRDRPEFDVIASDSGLLESPVKTQDLFISMGERYEIVVDFSEWEGRNVSLRNTLGFSTEEDYHHTDKVMRFVVAEDADEDDTSTVPSSLRTVPWPSGQRAGGSSDAGGGGVGRHFIFEHTEGRWQINGITFDEARNRVLAKPREGTVETWQLENRARGSSHPVHLHLVDFRVLSRTRGGPGGGGPGSDSDGGRPSDDSLGGGDPNGDGRGGHRDRRDRSLRGGLRPYESAGLKDVVWLGPGETVTLEAHFAPWPGVYMFHCHNLIHEDHMMMAAFNVTVLQDLGYNETSYVDPMDLTWRPRTAESSDYSYEAVKKQVEFMCGYQPYAGASNNK